MANQEIHIRITGDAAGIDGASKKATEALGGLERGAKASKQAANELRMVMPQLTDSIVGLGSGQSPFTVLLQQGGQLKDMFGGIGPAARAVGTGISSMISPLTLGAAAAAGLVYAWSQGGKEGKAYEQAIVLSGNAAGATSGALAAAAANVGKLTGSYMASAEAAAQFAASGALPASQIEKVTAAAVRLAQVGGPSVAEMVKQYGELAKDPLNASIKLNESTNFLTESVYRQIRALVDQGKTAEAAALAQKTLTSANERMATSLEGNLGTLERAWRGVAGAASFAWKSMLNIGASDTLETQLKAAQADLKTKQFGAAKFGGGPLRAAEVSAAEDVVRNLQEQIRLTDRAADAKRREGDQVQALVNWDKTRDQYLTKAEQRERAIAKIREEGARAGASQAEIDKRIAEANDKFKDSAAPRGRTTRAEDPNAAAQGAAKEAADYWEQFARSAEAATAKTEDLSKAQEVLKKYLLSSTYRNASSEVQQWVLQQGYAAISAEQLAAAQKEEAKAVAESKRAHESYIGSLNQAAASAEAQVQKLRDEASAAVMAASMNISLAEALERVNIARLREKQTAAAGDGEAVAYIEREIRAREELLPLIAGKEREAKLNKEREDRVNAEKRAAEQISQSLTDALLEGGLSGGKALARYFKTLILRPLIQAAVDPVAGQVSSGINSLLSSILGSFGGGQGQGFSIAGGGADGFTTNPFAGFAAGGMHRGGFRIVGENGPELEATGPSRIFNADQTKSILSGGGGGAVINFSPTISIDSRSDSQQIAGMVSTAVSASQQQLLAELKARGVIA